MHLLHRHTMLGGGGDLRRAGGSPRAAPRLLLSKSESMKKRSTKKKSGTKGSKRARLRAGLAAALQELRLASRKRGPVPAADAPPGSETEVACRAADADAGPSCAAAAVAGPEAPANGQSPGRGATGAGRRAAWTTLMPLVLVLALACVVALGRAPAVGCCIACAAWWCRGGASDGRRRRSSLARPRAHVAGGAGSG